MPFGDAEGRWRTRFRFRFRFSMYSPDKNPKKVNDGRFFLDTRRGEEAGIMISIAGGRRGRGILLTPHADMKRGI